jgi:acylphosphatase
LRIGWSAKVTIILSFSKLYFCTFKTGFTNVPDCSNFETKTDMQRVKVMVDGRVQGVGYRYFVHQQASRHQINGYVKNITGGMVEIDAEGEPQMLNQFLNVCSSGPALARVDSFHKQQVTPYGYTRFRIMHSEDF